MARVTDVRNGLRRQIASARGALQQRSVLSDEAIHTARKDLKRARAALRLLRDEVGRPAYDRENASLREAAQPLGDARDAKVLLNLVEDLRAQQKKPKGRATLERLLLRPLRAEHRRALVKGSARRSKSIRPLRAAEQRVAKWRFRTHRTPALESGVARIYRRGRKALKGAAKDCSDEQLHESRKQAKYLRHAVEMLEPHKGDRLTKVAKRAALVADCLGDDHDLAVLQERVANSGDPGKALRARIQARRGKLQTKALKQGLRLYKRTPKRFMSRVRTALDKR